MADNEYDINIDSEDTFSVNLDNGNNNYSIEINPTDTYEIQLNEQGPQGNRGETGNGIVSYEKTGTDVLVDIYTITFTDGNTQTVRVSNGKGIANITGPVTDVLKDTYTIHYNDNTTSEYYVYNGKGIVNITGPSSSGLTDTYTINYNDGTTSEFEVENGNGITSISKTSTVGLVDTYTISFSNGNDTTFTVTNGEKGDTGNTGATGNGISSISKTSTSGLVDTYTITYTNGNDTTFDVTNGEKGDTGNTGATGNGISSITKTGTSGLVDTYTVDYTNGNDTTFTVTNGKDGIDGQDGANGADGFSPIATVTSTNTGATVSITDKNGTTTSNINDGFSPTATVSKSGTVTTITITDKNGTTTENVYDGEGSITDVKVDNTSVVTSGVANIDLTDYQKKDTAVTHTNNTSVGSTTQPVYVDMDGTVKQTTYQLNKTVPSDAVFTDTTYSEFTGADTVSGGTSGLVPAPTTSDVDKYLKGDGTWGTVSVAPEVFWGTKGTTTFQQFKDAYDAGMIIYVKPADTYGIYTFKKYYTISSKNIFEFTRTYRDSTSISTEVWTFSSSGDNYTNTTSVEQQVQSNWNETNTSSKAYIQNKPDFQKPLIAGDNISIDTVTPITLPSGYTQLTYIEGSGSQYIDTGWTYNGTYPIQIDCKFKLGSFSSTVGSYPTPYGLQTSSYTEWLYPFYTSDGIFKMHLGSSASIDSVPASLGRVYDTSLTLNNGTWSRTINGDTTTGTWSGTIATSANLFLCSGSAGTSSINQMTGNIYSFKITVNNTIVRNYVPCKRNSDSAVGMYDLATNTFKSSEVGSFLPGSEVTNGGEMISAIIPTQPTYDFHGIDFYSTDATTSSITRDCNQIVNNGHYYYTSNGPSGLGEQSTDGALYVQAYSPSWVVQIAQDYRTGNIFTRSRNNGTWTAWKVVGGSNITVDSSMSSTSTNPVQNKVIYSQLSNKVNTSSLVQARVIIQTYSSGTSWYRIWSDGWCEQGDKTSIGYMGKTVNVTLLKTYQSVNFGITANWAVSRNMDDNIMPSVIDESTIKLYSASVGSNDSGGTGSCYWITYGYLASGQF